VLTLGVSLGDCADLPTCTREWFGATWRLALIPPWAEDRKSDAFLAFCETHRDTTRIDVTTIELIWRYGNVGDFKARWLFGNG
jgi:hypothetical protein